jgi:hypothetical protein
MRYVPVRLPHAPAHTALKEYTMSLSFKRTLLCSPGFASETERTTEPMATDYGGID